MAAIRARGFRMVLNYAHSPASLVVPNMIGDLGVELISMNAPVDVGDLPTKTHDAVAGRDGAAGARRSAPTVGVLLDIAAERIWLVDETGQPIDGRDDAAPAAARAVGADRDRDAAGADHRDRTRWSTW